MIRKIFSRIKMKILDKRLGLINVCYHACLPLLGLFLTLILIPIVRFSNTSLIANPAFYIGVLSLIAFIYGTTKVIICIHINKKIYRNLYNVVNIEEHLS